MNHLVNKSLMFWKETKNIGRQDPLSESLRTVQTVMGSNGIYSEERDVLD
jgi:hypothetical protein